MQTRESTNNQKLALEVGITDSANLTAIFALFLKDTATEFLEQTGRFFMFPLAAMAGCIQAVLAWRQAGLDKGKTSSIIKAFVESIAAVAVTTAVLGGLIGATVFALASPIIFTVTLAAKAAYHIGASIYYLYQSAKATANQDFVAAQQHSAAARANAVGAVALILATAAVGLAMLAGKTIFAIFGVAAGIIGTSYALYNRFAIHRKEIEMQQNKDAVEPLVQEENSESLSHNRIGQRLTATPANTVQAQPATHHSIESIGPSPSTVGHASVLNVSQFRPAGLTPRNADQKHEEKPRRRNSIG